MTKGRVFISYGMGGAGIETWATGERLLVQRCRSIDLDTVLSPYHWNDVNEIVATINGTPGSIPVAVIGDSLGANEAPDIASRCHRPIQYLGGFQSSLYGVDVGVPANVLAADNIYNPGLVGFLMTFFGLGSRKWHLAPGNKTTVLRNLPHVAPHPDDWGWAQDVIFSQIHHKLLGV
jgi:hypothetical protein